MYNTTHVISVKTLPTVKNLTVAVVSQEITEVNLFPFKILNKYNIDLVLFPITGVPHLGPS